MNLSSSTFILGVLLLVSCGKKQPSAQQNPEQERGGVFQTTCATCHGEQGQGSQEKMTPSIAGLPRWYLEEQISKFRSGQRGTHPEDMHGQQMRAIVIGLSDVEISEALDVVETLPESKQKLTLGGDVTRGAKLYREYCMECHRFNGKGEVAFKSAPLAGLQDWYLLGQWQKFSSGLRGYHKDDESGPKMQKVTSYLSSDEDVRDIISYISSARN